MIPTTQSPAPRFEDLEFIESPHQRVARLAFENKYIARVQLELDQPGLYRVEVLNEFSVPLRARRGLSAPDVSRELERLAAEPSADD